MQRIHIVRRSHLLKRQQRRLLLMRRATLALRTSPEWENTNAPSALSGSHVDRPSTPRASPYLHVGCLIFRGAFRPHVGHLTTQLYMSCASLRFPRGPVRF